MIKHDLTLLICFEKLALKKMKKVLKNQKSLTKSRETCILLSLTLLRTQFYFPLLLSFPSSLGSWSSGPRTQLTRLFSTCWFVGYYRWSECRSSFIQVALLCLTNSRAFSAVFTGNPEELSLRLLLIASWFFVRKFKASSECKWFLISWQCPSF